MEDRKKTYVEDIERGVYDIKDDVQPRFKTQKGVTPEIIRKISERKNEPEWMLEFRLKALEVYNSKPMTSWGPDLSDLDVNDIVHYLEPDSAPMNENWDDVPSYIRDTFDRLGIPEAEKQSLAGVGAQYDSEVVYHSIHKELTEQGVIYTDIETAIKEHEDILKEYFMSLITVNDHKFAALHGAVWSGGSFIYVPKGVKVSMPLQSYFRLNAPEAGQFEHTLIIVDEGADLHFIEGCSAPKYQKNALHAGAVELFVRKGARLRYSTIENWSRNMYNLNTKRALVEEGGVMEWVSGSFGSKVSMLYPMTILNGERARCEFTGVTFKVEKNAHNCKSTVECESLMLDNQSRSDTIPIIDIKNDSVDIGHEAKIGRISDEAIFYLMSRGISEDEAKAMIVRGFVEPISKELPLEYAVELNKLIELELEGTIG